MPLTDESLSIREIAFRWAGLNSNLWRYRFYIPSEVKDNLRAIASAINNGGLFCSYFDVHEKYRNTPLPYEIYNLLEKVMANAKYPSRFLNAHIFRHRFAKWCQLEQIDLPDFWFSQGWVDETKQTETPAQKLLTGKRLINQQIWDDVVITATNIWSKNRDLTIADVVRQIKALPDLKASVFTADAIRKHIAHLSPNPSKPGRKPKRNS